METSAVNNPPTVFIVGATSSLAQALCHAFAKKGFTLILSGRDKAELDALASDLSVRYGTSVATLAADFMSHSFSSTKLMEQIGYFDHLVIASGDMGAADHDDLLNLEQTTWLNYLVPAQLATLGAQRLCNNNPPGSIVIITSVAGDRGRASNYIYGSAKAALATFSSGLRNRYSKKNLHVMTVKPGFVDTPMTWGMLSPLIASREAVANAIIEAMGKRKDVIYVPFFWRYIMLMIQHIPERIFKKLSL